MKNNLSLMRKSNAKLILLKIVCRRPPPPPPAVEKAKTLLEEGAKLVSEKQKLIRTADMSEHGWATIEEYLEDELAENSDDEKRMQKAEYRAGRKLKAAAAKTGKKKSMRKPEHVSGVLGRIFVPFSNAASQLPLSTDCWLSS